MHCWLIDTGPVHALLADSVGSTAVLLLQDELISHNLYLDHFVTSCSDNMVILLIHGHCHNASSMTSECPHWSAAEGVPQHDCLVFTATDGHLVQPTPATAGNGLVMP